MNSTVVIQLSLFFLYSNIIHTYVALKIAIIGGGVGGTTCAYFLNEELENSVQIDLYEPEKIGGRAATISYDEIDNDYTYTFEAGGSAINSENRYMMRFIKMFGLQRLDRNVKGSFGLFDGKVYNSVSGQRSSHVVVAPTPPFISYGYSNVSSSYGYSDPYSSSYGYNPYGNSSYHTLTVASSTPMEQLKSFMETSLEKFSNIYNYQSRNRAFETLEELLDISVNSLTMKYDAEDGFEQVAKLNSEFVNEYILSSLIVNYGQTLRVPFFVGMVSAIGAYSDNFQVEGGVKQIPESVIAASKATVYERKVTRIEYEKPNQYYILSKRDDYDSGQWDLYDYVVIATPMMKEDKKFKFKGILKPTIEGYFHTTVVTIVYGILEKSYFGLDEDASEPTTIAFTDKNSPIYAMSVVQTIYGRGPTDEGRKVWKIFSSRKLGERDLNDVFSKYREPVDIEWKAYPEYEYLSVKNRNFKLSNNLYYINAIEWAASSMEMSAIGAKNVALLIANNINGKDN